MILLKTTAILIVFAQTRSVVIPAWVWGLAIAALLVYVIWRGRRWTKGRGVTRAHQAEVSERQERAQVIMGHKKDQQPLDAAPAENRADPSDADEAELEQPKTSR